MRIAVIVVVLLGCIVSCALVPFPNVSAQHQAKSVHIQTVPCNVDAYVIDQDPQGLNVRSGPGKNFDVIGNLPRKIDTGIGVHITGSSGEWVQIDSAIEEGAAEEQTFFKGSGWVYGPLLSLTGIAHQPRGETPLYQQASLKARVIGRVPGGDDVIVRGCRGEWLYVDYKKTKGWAAPRTLCSNPLTTCA